MMLRSHFSLWLLLLIKTLPLVLSLEVDEEGNHVFPRLEQKLREQGQGSRQAQLPDSSMEEGDTPLEEVSQFLGIPGTTQTINGYDTALGNNPICWKGTAAELSENTTTDAVDELVKTVFPNPLREDFLLLGKTEILEECPKGNLVTIQKPLESIQDERLRTLRYYDYSLHVDIDLDTLDGDYIITDDGNATIALQVVVCSLGKSGFCSPFVHEQANTKEAIDRHNNGQEIVATEKKVKGDLHGGTHIHSPWVFFDLGSNRTLSENVTVPMIVNHPGDYFVIGTVQLYTGINGSNAYRWDIANALDSRESEGRGRYVYYQDPPEVKEVSDGVLYFSYAAIGVAGAVIVFLIGQAVHHRDHQVLQLSQGDFLIVFLLSALLATISSFLLVPKNDTYCRISYPILLIPIQLMYAITVGRLWRIHAVISPLLLEHLNKGRPGLIQRFVQAITVISFKLHNLFVCKKENLKRSTSGAKQQISQFQLALVVSIFTLPQVVIQLVALLVQPMERQIDFNEDESIGRATCGSGVDNAHNLIVYSFLLLVLLVIILLVMAHSSRKLPSLFNETRVIYDSTFLSMILLLLGGAVIALTDAPGTSPDVEYLVSLVLILSITLNSTVRIMMPKLKMVWKNQTVVVSKLVTDHHRKARERQADKDGVMHGVSGFDPSNSNKYQESFTKGDYDQAQVNRLLTIHSRSDEISMLGGRSSMSSRGDSGTPTEDFLSDKMEPEADVPKQEDHLAVIDESPSKKKTSSKQQNLVSSTVISTELDIESGESGSSPIRLSPNDARDGASFQDDQDEADVETFPGGAQSDDGDAGTSDDEHDLETAEKRNKASYFDQRASGFLKNAMAKGLSWRMTEKSDGNLSGRDRDQALDENQKGEQGDAESNKKKKAPHKAGKKRLQKTIVVTEDETPARRLVLKMLDLQDQLEAVNNKIMTGLAVTQEDWGVITKLTSKLDHTFNEEVEFEWDIERRYKQTLREVMPLDMSGRSWGTDGDSPNTKEADSAENPKDPFDKTQATVGRAQSMSTLSNFRSARLRGILSKAPSSKKTSAKKHDPLLGNSNHSTRSCPDAKSGQLSVQAPSDVNRAPPMLRLATIESMPEDSVALHSECDEKSQPPTSSSPPVLSHGESTASNGTASNTSRFSDEEQERVSFDA